MKKLVNATFFILHPVYRINIGRDFVSGPDYGSQCYCQVYASDYAL